MCTLRFVKLTDKYYKYTGRTHEPIETWKEDEWQKSNPEQTRNQTRNETKHEMYSMYFYTEQAFGRH